MVLIGIGGGSGAGKTALADGLIRVLGENTATRLSLDDYYHDSTTMLQASPNSVMPNYDHPGAFDVDLIRRQLVSIKLGNVIKSPVYSHKDHKRLRNTRLVEPRRVVILEGIMVLAIPSIVELLDASVFVDTPGYLRALRRLRRDVFDFGERPAATLTYYLKHVRPMYRTYVEPTRKHAQLIVSGKRGVTESVQTVAAWLKLAHVCI